MTATTYPQFNADTEGIEVAKAFASRIAGKTILITGVNPKGLGYSAAHALASQSPSTIIACGRSLARIEEGLSSLRASFPDVSYRPLVVDLASQASVRAAASDLLSWADLPAIHLVLNSAGVMGITERTLSPDGIEMHFATNHVGHWLLTCLLMPKILAAAAEPGCRRGDVRVVNVSSGSPRISTMRWSDRNFDRVSKTLPAEEQPPYDMLAGWGYPNAQDTSYTALEAYNQSKVANVLCGIGLTSRLYDRAAAHGGGVLGLAVHPGVIPTELGRGFAPENLAAVEELMRKGVWRHKSLAAGSSTALTALLDPKVGRPETTTKEGGKENYGCFFDDCQISEKLTAVSRSSEAAERLWRESEALVGQKFAW